MQVARFPHLLSPKSTVLPVSLYYLGYTDHLSQKPAVMFGRVTSQSGQRLLTPSCACVFGAGSQSSLHLVR